MQELRHTLDHGLGYKFIPYWMTSEKLDNPTISYKPEQWQRIPNPPERRSIYTQDTLYPDYVVHDKLDQEFQWMNDRVWPWEIEWHGMRDFYGKGKHLAIWMYLIPLSYENIRKLTEANPILIGERLANIPLWRSDMSGSNRRHSRWINVTVDSCNLNQTDLAHSTFRDTEFNGCKMSGTNFHASHFDYCIIRFSYLEGADMTKAWFRNTLLPSKMKKVDFSGAHFYHMDLSHTKFPYCKFDGASADKETVLPKELVGKIKVS